MAQDVRPDFHYGGDHTFSHGTDLIRAKLDLIHRELHEFLPELATRFELEPLRE